MLLIIEIILTIFAWRKGWKWLAIIPLCAALLIGFIIGLGIGAGGGSIDSVRGISIFLDVIVTGILIFMNVKGPKSTQTTNTSSNENA